MFGPNQRTLAGNALAYFHHREPTYRALLKQVNQLLRVTFQIPIDFDICLISASGTAANEAVMASLLPGVISYHPNSGEFQSRLKLLRDAHHTPLVGPDPEHYAMVHYETAECRLNQPVWPTKLGGTNFADCVSSFPYYAPPNDVDVWTTVSSKQIGALPVMSMAVVRRNMWNNFRGAGSAYSMLNLRRYAQEYHFKGESPHTPAIPLLFDLMQRLESFDLTRFRQVVDGRRAMFDVAFPAEALIGEGPVVVVKDSHISPKLAAKWNLYRSRYGYQFFLYSGSDNSYGKFFDEQQHGTFNLGL